MKKRILSVLLCLVMVLGLFPTVSFAAGSGSGATEDDPIVVSTFGDLKSVLEDNSDISMKYIKVAEGTTIDVCPEIESYSSAISVRGFKTLIVDGSVAVYGAVGSDIALDCLLSMNGAGSYLNLKGSGSLTFYGNGSGASNAVVRVDNQATLNVSGGITLTGSFNAATYGIAVWNDGGYVTIDGAQLKGRMAVSKGPWGGAVYALSGTTSIKNATLESEFVAGGTNNTDNEQGSVYVSRDATLTIEESTIKATTNNEDGYSIYLGQHNTNAVSNYLATNQKVYKLSDYTQLDANVASLKEDILISNREPSYVNLTIKDRANRTTIADLEPTDITPGGVGSIGEICGL